MVSKFDRRYYEEELRYLSKEGQLFARRHPDIAQYLGLEDLNPSLRDPHSERIIEAFAFLVGRLRRFMDHQTSELVHALFNLVYPHYLRPLPCKTVVQFTPQESMIDKPVRIERGTPIFSEPIGDKGRRYEFTTCHDILIQPLDLEKLYVDPECRADFSFSAALSVHEGAQATSCEFDELEFCLFGDPSECLELFNHLYRHLKSISVKGVSGVAPLRLEWSGFSQTHNLNRDEDETFSQLQLLRDFFDFPQRYFFFKIKGLQQILDPRLKDLEGFQIDFIFDQPFSTGFQIDTRHFKTFCCPAQNMFLRACEPIKVTGNDLEYLITPDLTRPDMEIHSMERVMASREQERHQVRPYYHFAQSQVTSDRRWFYTFRRSEAFDQGWDTYLRLIDLDEEGPDIMLNQTISIQAWCTNKHYPQVIKIGQINKTSHQIPETISVRNITQTSKANWPAIHTKADWDFISHLGLNLSQLSQLGTLKRLLELYNVSGSDTGKRKILGIVSVEKEKDHLIFFGQAVTGRQLNLTCDPAYFQHSGDLTLFTVVFGHFLRAYCPINSFIRLKVRDSDQSETIEYIAKY